MRKNRKYILVSMLLFLSMVAGLLAAGRKVLAEEVINCSHRPSCEVLGYNKTKADCENKDILHCPFDYEKIYCED